MDCFYKVSTRLWIPFQVALEYQENRLVVIADQFRKFGVVCDVIREAETKLVVELQKQQVTKKHSAINTDQFLEEIASATSSFNATLTLLGESQPDVFDDDKIRLDLESLLDGRIGEPPTHEMLATIYKDGNSRYSAQLPPGYLDRAKGQSEQRAYGYGGAEIKREFGDLILWCQIKDKLKSGAAPNTLVFVTDDEKEDWWWTVRSNGDQRIGPRPELVQELRSECGTAAFVMYNAEGFMRSAHKYLEAVVDDESLAQARDVALSVPAKHVRTDSSLRPFSGGVTRIDADCLLAIARRVTVPLQGISAASVVQEAQSYGHDQAFITAAMSRLLRKGFVESYDVSESDYHGNYMGEVPMYRLTDAGLNWLENLDQSQVVPRRQPATPSLSAHPVDMNDDADPFADE
jgi:hypothetical protein